MRTASTRATENARANGFGALLVVLALVAIPCATRPASAQLNLKGRHVTIYIGGGVGGAIDSVARTFAAHLVRHLPGEPTLVASNMPGNGGIQGAQYLFNVAAKDGTAAGMVNAGPVIDPLTRPDQERDKLGYDPRRFRWVGSLQKGDTVCSIWHTSTVKTIADARAREVPMASTGATSSLHRSAMLMNTLIGTRFKPIAGFDGGSALLAIERGEVDGMCNQLASQRTTRPQWLSDGKLLPIVQVAMTADPAFPGVPRAWDLVRTDDHRQMLEFYLLPWEFNHSFMLPPGTPDDAVAAWRKAFDAAVQDPAFLTDARQRLQAIAPRGGAEVTRLVEQLYATPKEVIERTNAATAARK